MKNILSALAIASLLFVSCKKEEEVAPAANEEVSVFSDSFSGPIDTAAAPVATATMPTPATDGTPTMITTTQSVTVPPPAPVAKGMNPAHGQPGHRCDIPVGAPLSSAPGKATVQQVKPNGTTTLASSNMTPGTVTTNGATITTVNNNSTPGVAPAPATPTVTAPGMNPPHGQEGHVCSVAVGAPLPK